jgi:hypothetical protein
MAQTNTQIDPLTTRSVLKCLSYAIDEIKLLRSIHRLNKQAQLIADSQINPRRERYLITEMHILHNRLETLREKARSQVSRL